jgi:hypothetical protein
MLRLEVLVSTAEVLEEGFTAVVGGTAVVGVMVAGAGAALG